ncbi:TPA: helix-turn-helix transcriptional regulator [Enterobacter hormaechei subsp. xiangfangensis]|uniref:helix-turn-helix domain-containing protein n=1 Tax=Enterobacter hormaechei TaxID=158836 RepID=UPI00125C043F|nr:AraC family transcriptional regulator [Enterobacter hormaechei]MCM7295265.1 AraC family transcriptional regulator [Enterobacter hormaechei]VAF06508.1 AraC family transcriptional regulator [Enterobacter hormaechei]
MHETLLPADQQFFADLLSGLVLNPQQLGRVWFAQRGASDAVGSVSRDWPRLDVVLRGEYGNRLVAGQQTLCQGEMLFLPAQAASVPVFERPVMLLSILFAPSWLGLVFHDTRHGRSVPAQRHVELPHPERGECAAMLMALTHLSASPQDQAIIQPLVLSLLHWCRKVVSSLPEPGLSRGDFLYQSICNWVQENYAESLSRDSVAALFNISANHLSRLFSQQGTMSFVDYVRWVRMAKARTILQKYHLPVGEVAKRCGYADSDYFSRLFRRQFGLTPGEYRARFQ